MTDTSPAGWPGRRACARAEHRTAAQNMCSRPSSLGLITGLASTPPAPRVVFPRARRAEPGFPAHSVHNVRSVNRPTEGTTMAVFTLSAVPAAIPSTIT